MTICGSGLHGQQAEQPELDERAAVVAPGEINANAVIAAELSRLAGICEQLELSAQARISRQWMPPKGALEDVYFVPSAPPSEVGHSEHYSSWRAHFMQARAKYAEELYREALQLADQGREAEAFRGLFHVLRENPVHADAGRILGPLANAVDVRPRTRRASTSAQSQFQWPAGTYSVLETPNFELLTRADNDVSAKLARDLEVFLALWRQVFYPLWAPPGVLKSKLDASRTAWPKAEKMQVVLLRDREDYLQTLKIADAKIDVSVGYYSPKVKKCFFYPGEGMKETLYHELTHQLMAEATHIRASPEAGMDSGAWLVEGIALYMESLTEHEGGYWTLGGVDAPRVQTARYRGVRDGYWPKWDEFVSAGIEAWKKDPDIARLYTHALGLTHVFMDGLISSSTQTAGDVEATASRELLMRALVSVYQQSPDYRELFVALGNEDDAAKIKYQQLLVLTDAQVGRLMLANRPLESLVLAGSQLTGETWQRLAAQRELEWLDLSFSNATTDDLMWLGGLLKLRRLSLEGTGIDGSLLATIGKLKTVTELDLSGCAIDDADLATLRNMQQLRVLWLTDTQISNQALATLKALPGLTYCDVSGTAISESEWDSFRQKHVGLGKLP